MNRQPKTVSFESFVSRDVVAGHYIGLTAATLLMSAVQLLILCYPTDDILRPRSASPPFLIGFFLATAALAILIFPCLLRRRYLWLCDVLATGTRVYGQIVRLSTWKGTNRIYFRYTHNGAAHETSQMVWAIPDGYEEGRKVSILVNRNDETEAYLEALTADAEEFI